MSAPNAGSGAGAVPLEGERKPVTALFADLVGSTSLAEGVDPEDWAVLVNRLYEVSSRAIARYDGTVTQLSGDGVVAIFGAPVAHEDDPERAIRAGLDLIAAVEELSDELRDDIGTDLEMRVGVNTGLAVVGSVGSEDHEEYTALGDAMNVAARMESEAEPGTVLITASTYEHVTDIVEAADRGGLEVKGKSDPVAAFEVTSLRPGATRQRGIPGLESPMIGRSRELEQLGSLLDLVEAGRGRAALILGEPGIGKSRLLAELRRDDADLRWLVGRCLSYGGSLPHHLITDLVASMLDDGGGAEVSPEAVADLVERTLGDGAEETTAHLLHLLGLPTTAETEERLGELDPTAVRRRYVEALADVLSAIAGSSPVVLCCEDLHWADASSVDVLEELARIVHRCPVLLVGTARPERESEGWRFVEHARSELGDALTELRLDALSEEDSRALVANLLEIESLPGRVRELILERTDGNPFFVEEVIRALIDDGLITRRGERWVASGDLSGVDVPDSIQGLLLGRIDRLAGDARHVLRVASVLSRTFTADLLGAAIEEPVDVHAELGTLEAHGLISIAATRPEISYTFRHALVQEAAYSGLLKRERRELHGRVADVLEERHGDHPEEVAGLVADHLDLAGEHDRAVPYLLEAGRQAAARYAYREAHARFSRAGEFLEGRTDPEATRLRVEARIGQVENSTTFVPAGDNLPLLEEVLDDAEELDDERLLARVHVAIAGLYRYLGDLGAPQFQASLERATEIGERLDDEAFLALPLQVEADMAYGTGEYRDATVAATRAAEILERREQTADAAAYAGFAAICFANLGDFDAADEWIERGDRLAQESGAPNAIGDTHLFRGMIEIQRGNLEEAVEHTQRGLDQANEIGNTDCQLVGSFNLGDLHLRMGDPEAAIPMLEDSSEIATYCNAGSFVALSQAWLAAARTQAGGDLEEELSELEEALERARNFGVAPGEAEIHLHRATLLAGQSDPDWDAVMDDLEAAIQILERLEAKPALARALKDHGMALEAAGRSEEAVAQLERAAELAEEMELAPVG